MDLTKLFKIFSDKTRVEVVKHLAKGECCSCQFEEAFNVSQPTLAYHLKMIRDSGLATTEKVGTWNKYHIDQTVIEEMINFLEDLKQTVTTNCNCK